MTLASKLRLARIVRLALHLFALYVALICIGGYFDLITGGFQLAGLILTVAAGVVASAIFVLCWRWNRHDRNIQRLIRQGRTCRTCAYDLYGLPHDRRRTCPECGTAIPLRPQPERTT